MLQKTHRRLPCPLCLDEGRVPFAHPRSQRAGGHWMQDAAPGSVEKDPSGHRVQTPVVLKVPAGQSSHSSTSSAPLKEPAGQTSHVTNSRDSSSLLKFPLPQLGKAMYPRFSTPAGNQSIDRELPISSFVMHLPAATARLPWSSYKGPQNISKPERNWLRMLYISACTSFGILQLREEMSVPPPRKPLK